MEHHHAAQSPAVDAHESSAYAALDGLDAHARPPEVLKVVYKQYQKLRGGDLDARTDLIDHSTNDHVTVKDLHGVHGQAPPDDMQRVFDGFVGLCHVRPSLTARDYPELPARVYEVSNMPGRVDVILECRPARRRGAEKVGRSLHLSPTPQPTCPTTPTREAFPSRPFQSRAQDEYAYALQRSLPFFDRPRER